MRFVPNRKLELLSPPSSRPSAQVGPLASGVVQVAALLLIALPLAAIVWARVGGEGPEMQQPTQTPPARATVISQTR